MREQGGDLNLCLKRKTDDEIAEALKLVKSLSAVSNFSLVDVGTHKHMMIYVNEGHEEEIPHIKAQLAKFSPVRRRSSNT